MQEVTSSCFVCLQEEDRADHILLHYPYAKQLWHDSLQELNFQARIPENENTLESWWLEQRRHFDRGKRKSFDALVALSCWSLWKQRNAWVFNNTSKQMPSHCLVQRVVEEFSLWERVGVGVHTHCRRE